MEYELLPNLNTNAKNHTYISALTGVHSQYA